MENKSKKNNTRKRKWEQVAIDEPSFFAADMDGFVSLEVLNDYDLKVSGNNKNGKVISIQEKKSKVSEMQKVKYIWQLVNKADRSM